MPPKLAHVRKLLLWNSGLRLHQDKFKLLTRNQYKATSARQTAQKLTETTTTATTTTSDVLSSTDTVKDKVALITGGASGIGLQYGKQLLHSGAKAVMLTDINDTKGKKAVDDLANEFGPEKIGFVTADVTDSDQLENAFQQAITAFDGLDVVVNNAAILNDTTWEEEINTNCMGLARGTLLGFQYMGKDRGGHGGSIVNIASALVFQKPGGCPIHVGTKYFAVGLGCSFGHPSYFTRTGVRVITLCPGLTRTPMLRQLERKGLDDFTGELLRDEIESIPAQRPEAVGKGFITVLKQGKHGSLWVCEDNGLIYEIEISTLEAAKLESLQEK